MYRWVKGVLVRLAFTVFAWASLLVMAAAILESRQLTLAPETWLALARWTLFGVVAALVMFERDATRRWLDGLSDTPLPAEGDEDDLDLPAVGDRTALFVAIMSFPFFILWLRWGEPALASAMELPMSAVRPWSRELALSAAWSWVAGNVAALVRSGLALGWARLRASPEAAARMASADRALPLFTAAFASLILLPTLIGTAGLIVVMIVILVIPFLLLQPVLEPGPATELLVTLGPDDAIEELLLPLWSHGARWERPLETRTAGDGYTWVVQVPARRQDALRRALEADAENVRAIELNAAVSLDPELESRPCRGPLTPGAEGSAKVAVIDTGVHTGHPALSNRALRASTDRHGHGTAMAGVAAMASPFVRILPLDPLAVRHPAADDIADAIHDAVDQRVDVISMSFTGSGRTPRVVEAAIQRALRADIAVVTAAGNQGTIPDKLPWPASARGVLVVTSIDAIGRRSTFSKTGEGAALRVAAPGEQVCAPTPSGDWKTSTGTSPATAWVAGSIAALHADCGTSPVDIAGRIAARGTWTRADHDVLRATLCY